MLALDPDVLAVILQWVEKAEHDLTTASYTLRLRANCPTDTLCFHAQQCVEKYLKALLVLNGVDFGRAHHISTLLSLLPPSIRPQMTPEEQERFTEYAVTTRYPGDYDPITREEAKQAVQIARRVRNQARRRLPTAAR